MENKIKAIFEFQRFAGNKRLDAMINDAEDRYRNELSDEDVEIVSAAGSGLQSKKPFGKTENK